MRTDSSRTFLAAALATIAFNASCADNAPKTDAAKVKAPVPAEESPLVKNAEATVDDKTVASKVTKAIQAETLLAGRKIDVQCQEGTVHLSGAVKTPDERQRAEGLAREIKGVKDVNNLIVLEKP